MGEGDNDTLLTASVSAYTTTPTELDNDVSAVTGTTVTLTGDNDATSTLELAGAALYLNGNPGATPDQLTPDTPSSPSEPPTPPPAPTPPPSASPSTPPTPTPSATTGLSGQRCVRSGGFS